MKRSKPVATFFAVTFAPDTRAPIGSVTVPRIVPRKVCATRKPAVNTTKARTTRNLMTRLLCLRCLRREKHAAVTPDRNANDDQRCFESRHYSSIWAVFPGGGTIRSITALSEARGLFVTFQTAPAHNQ